MTPYLTGQEAADLLGISRRSLYRWMDEGRVPWKLCREYIEAHKHELVKRPRGPRPNPKSIRYHAGRHRWPHD